MVVIKEERVGITRNIAGMGSGAYEQKYQLRKQRLEFREHNCDIKEGSMRFQ